MADFAAEADKHRGKYILLHAQVIGKKGHQSGNDIFELQDVSGGGVDLMVPSDMAAVAGLSSALGQWFVFVGVEHRVLEGQLAFRFSRRTIQCRAPDRGNWTVFCRSWYVARV